MNEPTRLERKVDYLIDYCLLTTSKSKEDYERRVAIYKAHMRQSDSSNT